MFDTPAASSFLTWMERRHASLRNPFRGTKARPVKAARRAAAYPSADELAVILDALAPETRVHLADAGKIAARYSVHDLRTRVDTSNENLSPGTRRG
jgi:hypothetical protein